MNSNLIKQNILCPIQTINFKSATMSACADACIDSETKTMEDVQQKRAKYSRAAKRQACARLQEIREWENCSESSELFQRVANQLEAQIDAEKNNLSDMEFQQCEEEESDEEESEDGSYESSFIDDASESDNDSSCSVYTANESLESDSKTDDNTDEDLVDEQSKDDPLHEVCSEAPNEIFSEICANDDEIAPPVFRDAVATDLFFEANVDQI